MLPSGIIATLPCFTGIVFVSGTLVVVRWLPDPLLAMILPWGCCIEEGGNPVVSTISDFFLIEFVLLLTILLPAPSSKRPHVFPSYILFSVTV